jgi:2'-hydroxyisoflavone reductase
MGPDAAAASYGAKKSRCEQLLEAAFGDKATIVRPGLIVGPGDLTDRFTYWPVRIERGGEILAPGTLNDPAQWIDVRDLTEWMVRLGENGTGGAFNAVGPRTTCGIGELLYGIKACFANDAHFTWVPQPFLTANNMHSWGEMPVWSYTGANTVAFCTSVIEKALAAGLTFRPLATTVRDALTWYHARPAEEQAKLRAGVSPEREREVLAAFMVAGKTDLPPALRPISGSETVNALVTMNQWIHTHIAYERREEGAPHAPEETLRLRRGACRA